MDKIKEQFNDPFYIDPEKDNIQEIINLKFLNYAKKS